MSHKESFLQYLQIEKRYSLHTVRSYLNDLDQFYLFLSSLGLPEDPVAVTSHDIRSWIVSMLEKNYSTTSIHRKISCLRVFYRYLRKEGVIKMILWKRLFCQKEKRVSLFSLTKNLLRICLIIIVLGRLCRHKKPDNYRASLHDRYEEIGVNRTEG